MEGSVNLYAVYASNQLTTTSGSPTRMTMGSDSRFGGDGFCNGNDNLFSSSSSRPSDYNTDRYCEYFVKFFTVDDSAFFGIGDIDIDPSVTQAITIPSVKFLCEGNGVPYTSKVCINDYATFFKGCRGLQYCDIRGTNVSTSPPSGLSQVYGDKLYCVYYVGKEAFKNITSFKGFRSTHAITSNKEEHCPQGAILINTIEASAFEGCTGLDGNCVFIFCSVHGYNDYGYIGDSAFKGCTSFDPAKGFEFITGETPDIPMRFGSYIFDNTDSHGVFPFISETITTIPVGCFAHCSKITDVTTMFDYPHDKIITIGEAAYEGCPKLSQANIHWAIENINKRAFYTCEKLSEVYLNEGLKYIGEEAFAHTAIATIEIPSSVQYIDRDAFANCPKLREVTFIANYPSTITDEDLATRMSSSDLTNKINELYIGQGVFYNSGTNTYQNRPLKIYTQYTDKRVEELPKHVVALGKGVFHNSTIQDFKAYMPKLKYVGHSLFKNCARLKSAAFVGTVQQSEIVGFEEENLTEVQLILGNSPEYTKKANRGLFTNCNALEYYQGPPDFLFGYTYESGSNDGYTYWSESSKLQTVVLTSNNIYQKDDVLQYTFNNIDLDSHGDGFLAATNPSLKYIYFTSDIDKIISYVPFGNLQKSRYPELRIVASLNNTNLQNITNSQRLPTDQDEEIVQFLTHIKGLAPTSESYTYFDDKVQFYSVTTNEDGTNTIDFLDGYRLSNSFYRTYFRISTDNVLLYVSKIDTPECDQVKHLYYMGKQVYHVTSPSLPFKKIETLHLSSDIEVIWNGSFNVCSRLTAIYSEYDSHNLTSQHPFSSLYYIHSNSFVIPSTTSLQTYYRKNEQNCGYYMATSQNQVLMYYHYTANQIGDLNFTNAKVMAKLCFHFFTSRSQETDKKQYLRVPFIGNIRHTNKVTDLLFNFTTVSDLINQPDKVEKLQIFNTLPVSLQGTEDRPTFGNAKLTHLQIVADLQLYDIIFSNTSFGDATNSHLLFGAQGLGNSVSYVPKGFMGKGHVKAEDRIILNTINCRYMNSNDDYTQLNRFNIGCFECVSSTNLKLVLPKVFQVSEAGHWFDFTNNNITIMHLLYPDSLENFVTCNYSDDYYNSFGSIVQVPFPYVETFCTIEMNSSSYVPAPTHLSFDANINRASPLPLVIPNNLLYNNKFLNSLNLKTVTNIDKYAFGAENEIALIEIFNCSSDLYDTIDINMKRVINGLSYTNNEVQTTTTKTEMEIKEGEQ